MFVETIEASAHAFPRPYDLPLPLGYWLVGAGGAVALSFLAAVGLIRGRRQVPDRAFPLPRRATDVLLATLRSASVLLFVLLIAAGLFGDQGDWDRNVLPVTIWVAWWVGMAFACALVGDAWALMSPWASAGQLVQRMPTRRSAGVAVVLDGLIYVAGGRPPHGNDFDPEADRWELLPDLPSQRNHIAGAAISGRIHVIGGRLGGGFRSDQTAAHEVFDPSKKQWSVAAPMLRPRSGINGVLADGCLHAWGGESSAGMFPDHDYYDPRSDSWTRLSDMPLPVHGVTGSAFVNGLIHAPGGGTEVGGSSGGLHNQVYRPAISCS